MVDRLKNINSFKIRRFFIFTVSVCMLFTSVLQLTGCSGKKNGSVKKDNQVYLYYCNKDRTKLVYEIYTPEKEQCDERVNELLEEMNNTSSNPDTVTAKPEEVRILGVNREDDTLIVNFSATYNDMNSVEEVLCRAAIVLTLTQIEGVTYVEFNIENIPLIIDEEVNEEMGAMKAEDFVDIVSDDSNINSMSKYELTVYYINENNMLEPYVYDIYENGKKSTENIVIDKLKEIPEDKDGITPSLSENVRVISTVTKDGICYVNFSEDFLKIENGMSPELNIYSIVNSLCEINQVNKVQISVEGNTDVTYGNEISLKYAFSRDLDFVEK